MLLHVDRLVYPVDFIVLDTKGTSEGSVILGQPFMATGKANIDVETGELTLKSNKKKVIFKVYDWELKRSWTLSIIWRQDVAS